MGGHVFSGTPAPVFCPAGQWTSALTEASPGVWYRDFTADSGTTKVFWRRYGMTVVPYCEGVFTGREKFRIYPGDVLVHIDFKPQSDVTIIWHLGDWQVPKSYSPSQETPVSAGKTESS